MLQCSIDIHYSILNRSKEMMKITSQTVCLSTWLVTLVILLTGFGCGRDSGTIAVDFSTKLSIQQPKPQPSERPPLNVAVAAMISPKETSVCYRQLLNYIAAQLGRDLQLIQRKTYDEINTLFGKDRIDLAFICSGPYVLGKTHHHLEALAMPQVRGSPLYQSYLIVNKQSAYRTIDDLRCRGIVPVVLPDTSHGCCLRNILIVLIDNANRKPGR